MFFCPFLNCVASFGEQNAKQENGSCTSRLETYFCLQFFSPFKQITLPLFFSPNGTFVAEWHYHCKQVSPQVLLSTLLHSLRHHISGLGCFPVGENNREKFRNVNLALMIERRLCKSSEDEEYIHIVIYK